MNTKTETTETMDRPALWTGLVSGDAPEPERLSVDLAPMPERFRAAVLHEVGNVDAADLTDLVLAVGMAWLRSPTRDRMRSADAIVEVLKPLFDTGKLTDWHRGFLAAHADLPQSALATTASGASAPADLMVFLGGLWAGGGLNASAAYDDAFEALLGEAR